MVPFLSDREYGEFVAYAEGRWKTQFVALASARWRCGGRRDGTPCPWGFEINFANPSDISKLKDLHLDHAFELQQILDQWKRAIAAAEAGSGSRRERSWQRGVNVELLCRLLFSAHDHPHSRLSPDLVWRANLSFRCYRCHGGNLPHYDRVLDQDCLRLAPLASVPNSV
jgi:hypothetical protein